MMNIKQDWQKYIRVRLFRDASDKYKAGSILILIGLIAVAFQYIEGLRSPVFYFSVACVLLGIYFYKKVQSCLIAGAIIFGLGFGSTNASFLPMVGNPFYLGLGMGFILIFIIQRLYEKRSHWWPLVPGFILLGLEILLQMEKVMWFLVKQWSILLVILGIYLVYTARKQKP